METKLEKLQRILQKPALVASEPPRNVSQEVYRGKLAADIARTKQFLQQAKAAIQTLQDKHGPCPEVRSDPLVYKAGVSGKPDENTGSEHDRKLHLVALYEAYKQMPYQAMKNDSIGIATALTLTSEAVDQQTMASEQLSRVNTRKTEEIAKLHGILSDYQLANALIKQRAQQYPQKMAAMQRKIDNCTTYDAELDTKLVQMHQLSDSAKSHEERLHQHLQRVMMKVYATMDWESAHLMDEQTFRKSLSSSVSFLKNLVLRLGDASKEKWVPVIPGTAEHRLVEVMIRNDVLIVRENNGMEVRLRDYGTV
ncbi:hypothetical protein JCM33374_g2928 [Metschnikowia sp. JCM 33374]|nr:hypothetical protein JCM33374_g2928 [Metschnikowia sp. JCM 33374]